MTNDEQSGSGYARVPDGEGTNVVRVTWPADVPDPFHGMNPKEIAMADLLGAVLRDDTDDDDSSIAHCQPPATPTDSPEVPD